MLTLHRRTVWILTLPLLFYVAFYSLSSTARLLLPGDAYYSLGIARHIALGRGATFDGINPATGYHPLWCAVLSVVGLLGLSKDGFIAAAIGIQGVLVAGTIVLLFRSCVRAERPPTKDALVVTALWLANFHVARTLLNGLESALLAAALAAVVAYAAATLKSRYHQPPATGFGLGVLSSIVLLSRLDSLFWVSAVAVVWIVARRDLLRGEWRALAVFLGTPALTLAVYVVFERPAFGPTPGVSDYVARFVGRPAPTLPAIAVFAASVALVVAVYRFVTGRFVPSLEQKPMAYAILTVLVLTAQAHAALVGAAIPRVQNLAPHALWALTTLWLLFEREDLAARVRTGVYGTLGALALVSWTVGVAPQSYDLHEKQRALSDWLDGNLPAGSVVAGWDMAVTGYFAEVPVINLDGRASSYAYAQALARGEGTEFLQRAGVTHLVQRSWGESDDLLPRGYDAEELRRRVGGPLVSMSGHGTSPLGVLLSGKHRTGDVRLLVRPYDKSPPADAL